MPGGFGLLLIFIALVAAVPRLSLGASQYIEYDGYWHVFIAQQDNWAGFWAEINSNAHPPLYFLLLRIALRFGHSLLVYRSISLLTGIASVVLVGWIARKVTGSNVRACQSTLAYGLALPGIIVSCEVRSYMLSVFFILLSFLCLLDILGSGNTQGEARLRTGFAAGAILACLSHYFAFFYSGAAIILLLGRFAVRKYKGEPASWRAEAATILPVAASIFALYQLHAGRLAQIQGHLLPYYYNPQGHESVAVFLLRNWKNFLNLFSPYQIPSDSVAFGVLILALFSGLLVAALLRRAHDAAALRASWTILITGAMLAEFALGALAGKYPFGGDLRQQYLLFPFLVLSVTIFVETIVGKLSGFVPVYGRLLLNALVIVAIVWVSVVRFEQYPKVGGNVAADRIAVFDQLEPAPTAVYLDQFNLITFFIYHHTWDWSFLQLRQPIPGVDVYRLQRGPKQMLVFRDKTQWNLEPDDSAVYNKLAECLRAEKIGNLSVFSARQTPPKPPFSDVK
ncbi:MAG: Dolichyl-phosphate-mannose-protein mannosyltransferase, partial [Bryobacterales bacterium]|nr:Dolichyl-phosphate-mannose-protein mannosyltransferase [Bryobacterales bacterium]